jgi:hypothetical protein
MSVLRSSHIVGVASEFSANLSNGLRVLQFAADEIESDEFVEDLRRYLDLPSMVPEIRLINAMY